MAKVKTATRSKPAPKTVQVGLTNVDQPLRITFDQHEALKQFICDRLEFGDEGRRAQVDRYREIDKSLAGFLELNKDDKQREKENRLKGDLKPTDLILQLAAVQLDEELTYLMSVLAPDGQLYTAVTEKDKQEVANAFAAVLNKHAQKGRFYREICKALLNGLKFNLCALTTGWCEEYGNKISDSAGAAQVEFDVVWQGNKLRSVDMYNFIYDRSVHPVDLPKEGEFFAEVDLVTSFKIKKMIKAKQIFDYDRIKEATGSAAYKYYEEKPTVQLSFADNGEQDWIVTLTAGKFRSVGRGHEIIRMVTHIVPSEYGLSESKDLEIWEFYLTDAVNVVGARHLDNAHGILPIGIGMPLEDDLRTQTKSYAEMLIPLQRFGSFLINTHQRAARKSLYKTTFYDPLSVDFENADMDVAGRVPVKLTGAERRIQNHVLQFPDPPMTNQTMEDLQRVYELMQILLPTNLTQQVASLERATLYQAAATVQGTNRRSHKMAKLLHSQLFEIINFQLMYNTLQYQPAIELIDEQSGQKIEVAPNKFRTTQIEFTVSDGLKGIDRLMVVESIKEIIGLLLQRPDITQEVDMMGLINYWSSLLGDRTDLKQFKIAHPIDALPPEQKNMAMQLLQDAAAQQQQQTATVPGQQMA